jgi:hypothetical protein
MKLFPEICKFRRAASAGGSLWFFSVAQGRREYSANNA